MNRLILQKLEVAKEFQDKYPNSHLGGSIGLLLLGVDLKRDLSKSDLDITTAENILKEDIISNYEERSDVSDFDYAIQKQFESGYYLKIDVRISPEPQFDVINFNGINYNVSKLKDILFWKRKYANKGVLKHSNDLITIESGVRPKEEIESSDDLTWLL